jgi:hypothetical protein
MDVTTYRIAQPLQGCRPESAEAGDACWAVFNIVSGLNFSATPSYSNSSTASGPQWATVALPGGPSPGDGFAALAAPRACAEPGPSGDACQENPEPASVPVRNADWILVLEDDPLEGQQLREILEELGFKRVVVCVTAAQVKEAVERTGLPSCALVDCLLDGAAGDPRVAEGIVANDLAGLRHLYWWSHYPEGVAPNPEVGRREVRSKGDLHELVSWLQNALPPPAEDVGLQPDTTG